MNKILNFTILLASNILFIFIIGFYFIYVASDTQWEIRKVWFTPVYLVLVIALAMILFSAISIKAFISIRRNWHNFILSFLYILIFLFAYYLFFENRPEKLFIAIMVISGFMIILPFILKRQNFQSLLFAVHLGLFSIFPVYFIFFITVDIRDNIAEDKAIIYKLIGGEQKVILQEEDFVQQAYLISHDLGVLRKKTKFKGWLPDGDWQMYGKDNEILAVAKFKNGYEISRKYTLTKDKVIVKSEDDILSNIQKTGITFLFDGHQVLNSPVELTNCNNLKFESIPGQIKTNNCTTAPCSFIIKNSNNLMFDNMDFKSKNYNAVIEIINSHKIKIINSTIDCQESTNYGVLIDEYSRDIAILNNRFYEPVHYSLAGYSNALTICNNSFHSKNTSIDHKSILLKDKKYDSSAVLNIFNNAILNYVEPDVENKSFPSTTIFGKRYYNFHGKLTDLLDRYSFLEELNSFIAKEYCSDCRNIGQYHNGFFEIITGNKLFENKPASGDKWCFDINNHPKFSFVNPRFFEWLAKDLDINPDAKLQGVTYRLIYKSLFSNLTRDYYIAYKQLNNSKWLPEIIEQYKLAVDSQHSSSQIDLYLYHKLRPLDSLKFKENLNETKVFITGSDYIIAKDYTNLLSFWIRRHIDGSANQIHETIIYYLSKFDKEWLDRNR